MRTYFVYLFLRCLQKLSRVVFRHEYTWVGDVPAGDLWQPYRLVAILNHTSLFEFLFAGMPPARFLRRMAVHCTIPIADITLQRPLVGLFWRSVAGNIVSVSRERDHTWEEVLEKVQDPDSMIIILPEGRMKRANGLDKHGRPMRVRTGIADLVRGIPDGKLLICYSQGLHHIQVPGEGWPKLFRPVRARFETLDIRAYREAMQEGLEDDDVNGFKACVVRDLTERRDRYCTSDRGGTDKAEAWQPGEQPIRPGSARHRQLS